MTSDRHNHIIEALNRAGLTLPDVQAPLAAYTPALVAGDFAFTSGQLPLVDGELAVTGTVGVGAAAVPWETARQLAAVCALNGLAALNAALGDLGRIERIVKVTGFVASEPSFTEQSSVVDGASHLLAAAFGDRGIHTRSAVGVASLPKNSPVEVELTVTVR